MKTGGSVEQARLWKKPKTQHRRSREVLTAAAQRAVSLCEEEEGEEEESFSVYSCWDLSVVSARPIKVSRSSLGEDVAEADSPAEWSC